MGGEKRKGKKYATFYAVGDSFVCRGHRLTVIPRAAVTVPADACRGCWFAADAVGCGRKLCSMFDRRDGKNVWFTEFRNN